MAANLGRARGQTWNRGVLGKNFKIIEGNKWNYVCSPFGKRYFRFLFNGRIHRSWKTTSYSFGLNAVTIPAKVYAQKPSF